MKKITLILITLALLLTACHFRAQERTLFNGIVYLQNTDVPLIHLRGKEVWGDSLARNLIFLDFFLEDSVFIRSHIRSYMFWERDDLEEHQTYWMLDFYSLPDVERQQSIQSRLPAPIRWSYTTIPTNDPTSLYYLLGWEWIYDDSDEIQQHIFSIDVSGKVTHLDGVTLPFDGMSDNIGLNVSSITHIGNNDFIYQHDSLIVRTSITEKGMFTDTLFHILHHPHRGHLLVNTKKNRMVFAHRHHHLFHIMDLRADTVKTVDFKNGIHRYCRENEFHRRHQPNPTYFEDAFAGKNYFYLLFWGRTDDAFREHTRGWRWIVEGGRGRYEKTEEYAQNIPNIVERYDWNGNLVARYLLEGNPVRWGGFWVDERNRQFYILAAECQGVLVGAAISCLASLMVYSFCQE